MSELRESGKREEYFSPLNLWNAVVQNRLLLVISMVVMAIFATYILFFVMSPKWEASAVLQVGQVGQVVSKPIEPVGQVLSRMKHISFARAVFNQPALNGIESKRRVLNLYKESLKVTKPKDVDVIEFKFSAYSPEQAQLIAENTVSYLQKIHTEMMADGVNRVKSEIKNVEKNISDLKSETNALKKRLEAKQDWDSYNATLSAMVLQNNSDKLRLLEQRKLELDEQLSPNSTFTTKLIGDVAVAEEPTFPFANIGQKMIFILGGALLGLLGALFFVLLVRLNVSGEK